MEGRTWDTGALNWVTELPGERTDLALATVLSGHSNKAHKSSDSEMSPIGCVVSVGPMVSAWGGWGGHGLLYHHLLPTTPFLVKATNNETALASISSFYSLPHLLKEDVLNSSVVKPKQGLCRWWEAVHDTRAPCSKRHHSQCRYRRCTNHYNNFLEDRSKGFWGRETLKILTKVPLGLEVVCLPIDTSNYFQRCWKKKFFKAHSFKKCF